MPKSRFRISKSARNDPLARPSSAGAGGAKSQAAPKSAAAAAASDPTSPAFALSLLNKLSLPSASSSSLLPITEAIWTLSALGTHIGAKPIRTALLHPEQKLGPRILHALDPATYASSSADEDEEEDRLALLTQAAGVLRNLCIDAPWGVRDNLAKQGLISRCIAVLQLIIYGHHAASESSSTGAASAPTTTSTSAAELLNKPVDQMNRKEKRHAAKAAAALQAARSSTSTSMDLIPSSSTTTAPAPASTAITPALLASSPHTLPLLDNILTLLWCLAESASDSLLALIDRIHSHSHSHHGGVLDEDRERAHLTSTIIADVLIAAVQVGLLHASPSSSSSSLAETKKEPGSSRTAFELLHYLGSSGSAAGKKGNNNNNTVVASGLRQLGITAANALCALTDECPAFVRTLLGIGVDPIISSTSTSFDPSALARALSARRLGEALKQSVDALESSLLLTSGQEHSMGTGTAQTLGVLASAITRNIVHTASTRPDELFSSRHKKKKKADEQPGAASKRNGAGGLAPRPGDSAEIGAAKEVLRALLKVEQAQNVGVLLRYVELEAAAAAPSSTDSSPTTTTRTGWIQLVDTAAASSSCTGADGLADSTLGSANKHLVETRRANDRVQAVQLALEVLAELASAASAVAVAEDAEEQRRGDAVAALDGEGDHDMLGDAAGADDGDVGMEMEILDRDGEEETEEEEEVGMETDQASGKNGSKAGGPPAAAASTGPPVPFVFALTSEHQLPTRLLSIVHAILTAHPSAVFPSSASTDPPSSSSSSTSGGAALLRALISRSLSAAANALLSVASEAPPTPSEPEYLEPLDWSQLSSASSSTRGKAKATTAAATKERFLSWADPAIVPGAELASGGGVGEKKKVVGGYEVLVQLWDETWVLALGLAEIPAVVGKPLLPSSHPEASPSSSTNGNGGSKSVAFDVSSLGITSSSTAEKEGDEGTDGRVSLEACLSILWAIARSFEPILGLPRPTQPSLFLLLPPPDATTPSSPFRSDPLRTIVPALQAAYLSAQSDSMRVRVLGTLGCVGRLGRYSSPARAGGQVVVVDEAELEERNRAVGETLLAVLEALPSEGASAASAPDATGPSSSSLKNGKGKAKKTPAATSADAASKSGGSAPAASDPAQQQQQQLPTTTPECMVAALNAVIDLYADERASWDVPVFRAGQYSQRLRKLVSRVRAGTRAIDKRTDPGLRARADETAQNYRAFVEFRETVK
ncbi:hypothetical protein V8E36_009644 [Tilletia maclaganii]